MTRSVTDGDAPITICEPVRRHERQLDGGASVADVDTTRAVRGGCLPLGRLLGRTRGPRPTWTRELLAEGACGALSSEREGGRAATPPSGG